MGAYPPNNLPSIMSNNSPQENGVPYQRSLVPVRRNPDVEENRAKLEGEVTQLRNKISFVIKFLLRLIVVITILVLMYTAFSRYKNDRVGKTTSVPQAELSSIQRELAAISALLDSLRVNVSKVDTTLSVQPAVKETVFNTVVVPNVVNGSDRKRVISQKVHKFSAIWLVVAETCRAEGWRDKFYRDGDGEAIGFGYWAKLSDRRRKLFKRVTGRDVNEPGLKITRHQGLVLTTYECLRLMNRYSIEQNLPKEHPAVVALALRAYNIGAGNVKKNLPFTCCGGTIGCGSRNKHVRASHDERRKRELLILVADDQHLQKIGKQVKKEVKDKFGITDNEIAAALAEVKRMIQQDKGFNSD